MTVQERRVENMRNDLIEQLGDIKKATREQINEFVEKNINNYSISTKRTKTCILNKILRENQVEVYVATNTKNDVINIDGIYTEQEMKNIVNSIINPIDQFIVWSLFNGIKGTAAQDLLSIKKSDFNEEQRTLTIGTKEIQLDDYYFDIVKSACEQKIYIKNNINGMGTTSEDFEFNDENPYIIRGKRTTKNNDGLDKYGYNGFTRKLLILSTTSGFILKPDALEQSFFMSEMFKSNIDFNMGITKRWIKEKGYKTKGEMLYRKYKEKYKG